MKLKLLRVTSAGCCLLVMAASMIAARRGRLPKEAKREARLTEAVTAPETLTETCRTSACGSVGGMRGGVRTV